MLSINEVAARHRLHPRYIQRAFEATGTTFSDFVLSERLASAHRMLVEFRYSDMSIGAIAFACGFGDLSYFNRCFRRRFGAAPSLVRAKAMRDRQN